MKEAKNLIEKYKSGKCTPEELALLHKWIDTMDDDLSPDKLQKIDEFYINAQYKKSSKPSLRNLFKYSAAAIILISICFSIYKYFYQNSSIENNILTVFNDDVLPGKNLATITLSNGKKIALDTISTNFTLAANGINAVKNNTGELNYFTESQNTELPIENHIIETPLKGMFKITLSDGSKVWINSLSKIKFPNRFSSQSREIELKGEAYFEIANDPTRPFVVNCANQKVEVLGTHFNVRNYEDDFNAKTTLLEGSIRLTNNINNSSKILNPGEQATIHNESYHVQSVNVISCIDWKNGDFIFEEESLAHIMKRIARWYGVRVFYSENIDKKQTFSGQVSRNKNLSEVLNSLSETADIEFKIKDNDIYIN